MSVINTNYLSLVAQNNLGKSQSALGSAIERLSSGLRINSAKDDAAGQAIANRMTSQVKGLNQAQRNANDGISVAQTAEGALNQVNDNLQRVRELAVQATNGTNSSADLKSIQEEIGQRLNEINRISAETDFNGVKVLSDTASPVTIQVGAQDGQTISVGLQTINQETLGLDNFDVSKMLSNVAASDDAFTSGAVTFSTTSVNAAGTEITDPTIGGTFAGNTAITFASATGDAIANPANDAKLVELDGKRYVTIGAGANAGRVFEVASITDDTTNSKVTLGDEVTGDLLSSDGTRGKSFSFDTTAAASAVGTKMSVVKSGSDYYVRSEATNGDVKYFSATVGTSDANGTVAVTLTDNVDDSATLAASATLDPMKLVDEALSKVDSLRSELGAVQNRFEDAIKNLQTNSTNLQAARSRIEDADYAVEVANMSKNQILQQAGTSVLAQANQIPQGVLSLLR